MTTTLSGQFVSFTAEFSHSDELGGRLTSLLQATNTHILIRDVLVDLPGRDSVRDFLAQDALFRVFESNGNQTVVDDLSSSAALSGAAGSGSQVTYDLTVPPTGGFLYAQVSDPLAGSKEVVSAIRSDGKPLRLENVWTSKKVRPDHNYDYFINLFDANSPGVYTITLDTPVTTDNPPVLQFIADKAVSESSQVSFIVEASDPNGQIPALSAHPLMPGAVFTDNGNGTGIFDWTPPPGSAGTYPIVFEASDGQLKTAQMAQIIVIGPGQVGSDGDGIDDAWEMLYFNNLTTANNTSDFDGDGVLDLDEFRFGSDPTDPRTRAVNIQLSLPQGLVPLYYPLDRLNSNSAFALLSQMEGLGALVTSIQALDPVTGKFQTAQIDL